MKSHLRTQQRGRWQTALTLLALVVALHPPAIFARDAAVNVASTLAYIQEHTVSAHVVLWKDYVSTVTRTTEEYLTKHGCHYEVNDQQSVTQLLENHPRTARRTHDHRTHRPAGP